MKVCLFDPGLGNNNGSPSSNLGDLIIQEAVTREISALFNNVKITQVATHSFPQFDQLINACSSDIIFVGGTNLLGSRMDHYKQWKVSLLQKILIQRAILLGVGWEQYQVKPNFYTRMSLKLVLDHNLLHSVRDSYTEEKLKSAGIPNVINTGCPTMWPLMSLRAEDIPTQKSDKVLVMLTDYRKNYDLDRKLLELLTSRYEQVIAWPQGKGDREYISELFASIKASFTMLDHSFKAFQDILQSDLNFDYIGTRLHGGIKCLLSKRRSLILEVDNRAKEISKDTHLYTVERSEFSKIIQWIDSGSKFYIKLNHSEIQNWKSQFKSKI